MTARVLQLEATCHGDHTRMNTITETLVQLGNDTMTSATSIQALRNDMTGATREALEAVNSQFDRHQAALLQVVQEARLEFDAIKANLTVLYGGTGSGFTDVLTRVSQLATEVDELKQNGPTGGEVEVRAPVA